VEQDRVCPHTYTGFPAQSTSSIRLTFSAGNGNGSITLNVEGFHFTDPNEGTGSAEVFISANPIKPVFDRQWFSQGHSQDEHRQLHGFPALYFGNSAS